MRERRSVQELPKWMLPSGDSSVREFFEEGAFKVGERVQLHPSTDRWMMGDRFGEVVSRTQSGFIRVKLDKSGLTLRFKPELLQHLR